MGLLRLTDYLLSVFVQLCQTLVDTTYGNVLLNPSARKDSVKFRAQLTFAEKSKDDGFSQHGLQCVLAVSLSVDPE